MKRKLLKLMPVFLALALMVMGLAGCRKSSEETSAAASAAETVSVVSIETASSSQTAESTAETSQETAEVSQETAGTEMTGESGLSVSIDGEYTSKEEVAAYINAYKCLPSNYITRSEAKQLGWDSNRGNLWDVAPGKSIGGDRFGNYEGHLPDEKGRVYYECDIGYEGGYRGAERIIYSNDGLIYYTDDHYNTFELLYGQE